MKQYFEGYYFKCSTQDQTVALIPAVHCDGMKKNASLQVITNERAYRILFPMEKYENNKTDILAGENHFSEKGIELFCQTDECRMSGQLRFGPLQKIRYDIMGPFALLPMMECRHTVVSMRHSVSGNLCINGKEYLFQNGVGYIEGDSGCSFPEEYLWTQCHFHNGSLMLSVAKIPLFGMRFWGVIGIVMTGEREYRLATYLGAKIHLLKDGQVVISQGKYRLEIKLIGACPEILHAPDKGKMTRQIRESAACEVYYRFSCGNRLLLQFTSKMASFEYEFHQNR